MKVARFQSGMKGPQAKNKACKAPPQERIAGFGRSKTVSTKGPKASGTRAGVNAPKNRTPKIRGKTGNAQPGPSRSKGGSSQPKYGSGPSGIGKSGSKFPGM